MQVIAVLILQLFVIYTVLSRQVSLLSLFAWLGSIALTVKLFKKKSTTRLLPERTDIISLIILSIVQLAVLWYFGSVPTHYHQDEFITAYTSWTLPALTKIDWFGVYPEVWVSQFPVLFHILQKPFFWLFGPTVTAMRTSVWPYAIGILVYLYYFVRIQFTRKIAVIACILYIFSAPHMYLSSMGLHFISSTFFYIAALTHFLRGQHVTAGIFTGASYLSYTSSYVTLPVLAAVGIIKNRKGLAITVLVAMLVVSPWIVYAATVNNFFVTRVDQVSALWGSWSDPVKLGVRPDVILAKQTFDAARSLVVPGVGGLGGYNFGKLALLDPLSAILLLVGVVTSRNRIVLLATFVPFITGFILTTHPPPFHRLAIIYPFIALIISSVEARGKLKYLIPILIITNLLHTSTMIKNDAQIYPQNSRVIAEYIVKNIPAGSPIQIAAYPSFYLGQELLFRTNNAYPIRTSIKEEILADYDGGLLIILNATKEQLDQLKDKYRNYVVLTRIGRISLGDITLFVSSRGS